MTEEMKRKQEELDLRFAFRVYCCDSNLMTRASCEQYEIMVSYFSKEFGTIHDFDKLACMVWICSDTDKSINQIALELSDLYLNNI